MVKFVRSLSGTHKKTYSLSLSSAEAQKVFFGRENPLNNLSAGTFDFVLALTSHTDFLSTIASNFCRVQHTCTCYWLLKLQIFVSLCEDEDNFFMVTLY